jgi:hypothetical protein
MMPTQVFAFRIYRIQSTTISQLLSTYEIYKTNIKSNYSFFLILNSLRAFKTLNYAEILEL